jgi:hypothetical protein
MIELRVISGTPDSNKKACIDCRHMKASVNWWCTNEEARKATGNFIPNVYNCKFWEPALSAKSQKWWEKILGIDPNYPHILIKCGLTNGENPL